MLKLLFGTMVKGFTGVFDNISWIGIVLALVFCAILLAAFWPPFRKARWTWAVLLGSALLGLVAYAVIQYPLRFLLGAMVQSQGGILIGGLIVALVSGLVAAGLELIPVVVYRRTMGKPKNARMGLAIGAAAGIGIGFLMSMAALNMAQASHTMTLAEMWRQLLFVALNVTAMAFGGYGVYTGRGWQFWPVAGLLLAFAVYYPYLLLKLPSLLLMTVLELLALSVTAVAIWMRWWKTTD